MSEKVPDDLDIQADLTQERPMMTGEQLTQTGQPAELQTNTIIEQVNAWATSFALWVIQRYVDWWNNLPETWNNYWDLQRTEWLGAIERQKVRREALGKDFHPEIQEELDEIRLWPQPWSALGIFGMALYLPYARFRVWIQGISALHARKVNADLRPSMIDHNAIIRFMLLYPERALEADELLAELGLEERQQIIAGDAMRQVPQYAQILTMRNRDIITDEEALEMFRQQAVGPVDARLLLETRFFYPGPADIATLTGREAFEEDSIERFNLDVDFDRIPKKVYEKAGMTEEQMKWYWIAHWQNPGLVQVFQMLHRLRDPNSPDFFGDDDMDVFFNLADITPYFRDKLKAIAYTPFTRVDIRRMYNTGTLTYSEVIEAYQDIGYRKDKATLMADFTVKLEDFNERDLSRTQVEKLYEIGELNYDEFLDALEAVGYDRPDAEYVAAIKITAMASDRIDAIIDRIEWEYKRNLIDVAQVNAVLGPEGIRNSRIEQYIDQWDNENISQQTLPTKADIIGWFDDDIISQRTAITFLRKRHYSEANILRYLDLVPDQFVQQSDLEIVRAVNPQAERGT